MTDYVLDWDQTGADGSASFSSSTGGSDIGVRVSTPTNVDGKSFGLIDGVLISHGVSNDTVTEVEFDAAVSNVSFEVFDVDAGPGWDDKVTINAYDADGNLVQVNFSDLIAHHQVSGNTVKGGGNDSPDLGLSGSPDTVTVTIPGPITKLEIVYDNGDTSTYSGIVEISDISFDAAVPVGDGIVEGTSGDDVIDLAYTGDPDGDRIDNSDALLPGEAPEDDIVLAGDGDDLVKAGEGDDDVYAGGGSDTVYGEAGDDLIYGDDNGGLPSGNIVRESFEWDKAPDPDGPDAIDNGDLLSSFSQNTGNVDVNFTVTSQSGASATKFATDAQNVNDMVGDGAPIDANSSLANDLNGQGNTATYELDFSKDVQNISFNINDIDGDGVVKVYAYVDGVRVEIDIVAGSKVTLKDLDGHAGDETIDSNGGYESETSENYSATVNIDGPVDKIVVVHSQDGASNSGINITDVYFDVPEDGSEAGNDSLIGGGGADTIYGEGGDDVVAGGAGEDLLSGGAGADDIDGGTEDDIIFGDSLDPSAGTETGVDPVTLNFGDVEPGSETSGSASATSGDSVVYKNVAVLEDGTVVEARLVLVSKSSNDLQVDLANSTDYEIMLNGNNNGLMNGETATFALEFYDQNTGEAVQIEPGIVFADLDENVGHEALTITDPALVNVGLPADSSLNVNFSGGTLVANGTEDNLDPNDPDSQIATVFGTTSSIEFTLTSRDVNSGTNFGSTDNGDFTYLAEGGNDTIDGGEGDDLIYGQAGHDVITGGDGSDTVDGGDGDDVIDTSGSNPDSDYGFSPYVPQDTDMENDRDSVDGGAGNDDIKTGDDRDTISGGSGNDTIDGGLDDDEITGDEGDDSIIGGHGADNIDGGIGNDTIWGGLGSGTDNLNIVDASDPRPDNGLDTIHGGDGDDVIYGQDDDDVLYGDDGNDTIDGGIDEDTIFGGEGDDELIGGQGDDLIDGGAGADDMSGGDDRDTFVNVGAGDVVDGNEGGDDYDTLDLSGSAPAGGSLAVTYDGSNPENGVVNFFDAGGNNTGSMEFFNIEKVIPCFTPGTLIATPKGERRVEELQVGDRVITRDNGIQEIRWTGAKPIGWQELQANQHLKPILITAGSLGNGLPERDMLVSPNHRVLVANDRTALYFDEREVLVPAKHLVDNKAIMPVELRGTTYLHFMFDNHEVVLSDGAWTESFQPGDYSLKGIGNAQRNEIFELFPELETAEGLEDFSAARRTLKKHEAALLK